MKPTLLFLLATFFTIQIAHTQIIDIPDVNLKNALINTPCAEFTNGTSGDVDTNDDGEIQVSEAEAVLFLYVNDKGISNFTGISYFTNLERLDCNDNQLTTIDLSNNPNLRKLYCKDNQLTTLDFSNNTSLELLDCDRNNLTSLDISNSPLLSSLSCGGNQLTALDVSNNTSLLELSCWGNQLTAIDVNNNLMLESLIFAEQLTTLDVTNNTNLKILNCNSNLLTSLDISNNINLESLRFTNTPLTSLNISNNINLESLRFTNTPLTSLNISNNINLESLWLLDTPLTSLDVSNNINLEYLTFKNTQLTTLNLSNNSRLEEIYCNENSLLTGITFGSSYLHLKTLNCKGNQLTSLNLSDLNHLEFVEVSNNLLTSLVLNSTYLDELRCNNNQLTSLNLSNAINLRELLCHNNQLTSISPNSSSLERLFCGSNQLTTLNLSDVENLTDLDCHNNALTNLDVSNNTLLRYLRCENNQLATLDVSNNTNLLSLECNDNQLTDLDFSTNVNLESLKCHNNQLTMLDLSATNCRTLFCGNNNLISLNIKNGVIHDTDFWPFINLNTTLRLEDLPNLEFICVDEDERVFAQAMVDEYTTTNPAVNSYCSFTPGGTFYTVTGEANLDFDNSGCNLDISFFKLNITDGSTSGAFITGTTGDFEIPLQDGVYTITPEMEIPEYFNISPSSFNVNFPTDASPLTQDICVTPNGVKNDLEITILPLANARPGFDAHYKLIYKNKGNTVLSGSVDLTFQDEIMDLVSTNPLADSQTVNNLSWNYTNLLPFESREIIVTMNLNASTETPPLNSDDILNFTANANPIAGDETPDDNSFTLQQTVVNSFDPNDKTCLEGDTITSDHIGNNVHYLIRFENTGTANAINIVVKDIIDTSKFDISSLFLIDASHEVVTRITNDNTVEFIFENINLPFDDANNDGYIAFKIKTLDTLVEGDTFENDAEIYFDFNFPIITNTATTFIEQTLSVNEFYSESLNMYPNPVDNILNIAGNDAIKAVSIYDISGRQLHTISFTGNKTEVSIDTEALVNGTYLIKIKTEQGEGVKKIIKK
ncbi:T9SS type A sorting domain-containing protein [Dokdonia sp.]|uniref:DUF7619 domain-containing protein n=1 Tax=Dokdonia sp. TaxID=2024995 RepID=UPI003267221C